MCVYWIYLLTYNGLRVLVVPICGGKAKGQQLRKLFFQMHTDVMQVVMLEIFETPKAKDKNNKRKGLPKKSFSFILKFVASTRGCNFKIQILEENFFRRIKI